MIWRLEVFADYHFIVIWDAAGDGADLADRWTKETMEAMFVQGDQHVAIGTARNMTVPVEIRLEEPEHVGAEPPDRIVSGKLSSPSGVLYVENVMNTDDPFSRGRLDVGAGDHDVRVLYFGLETIDRLGLEGDDRYVVEFSRAS